MCASKRSARKLHETLGVLKSPNESLVNQIIPPPTSPDDDHYPQISPAQKQFYRDDSDQVFKF